jgi:hypothetical protein
MTMWTHCLEPLNSSLKDWQPLKYFFCCCLFFFSVGIKPSTLCVLGKRSIIEQHLSPLKYFYNKFFHSLLPSIFSIIYYGIRTIIMCYKICLPVNEEPLWNSAGIEISSMAFLPLMETMGVYIQYIQEVSTTQSEISETVT